MSRMTINKDQRDVASKSVYAARELFNQYTGRGKVSITEIATRTGLSESQLRHRYRYNNTHPTLRQNRSVVEAIYAAVKSA